MQFSFENRTQLIEKLNTEKFDLLIIGGGITGAGIALDAASRGLKVALVEKNDFASGTSSRSTKLIHGGLRYLKQLEFSLVKEVGSERAVVHNLAPHLVLPEKMLLPLSEGKGLGTFLTSFGLMLYDWLAGVKPADQRKMLTRKKTLRKEPLLDPTGIKGGGFYAEYRTDDARLTIEIIKTAVQQGATCVNYCEIKEFLYKEGKLYGARVSDQSTGISFPILTEAIVNATGPWVDTVRELDKSKKDKSLHLTKGVHLVVDKVKFPIQQAIYFDVADGRMIFAIPRGRTTYFGTTDTDYDSSLEEVYANAKDVAYLLNAVNDKFPSLNLTKQDIESSWAGLRPLIHEDGKSASALSRKDEIFESTSGLISIAGGKLTGYRKMAERVVDLLVGRFFDQRKIHKCHTQKIKVCGAEFRNSKDVRRYILEVRKFLEAYRFSFTIVPYLVHTYGKQTDLILYEFTKLKEQSDDAELNLLLAELSFCMRNEMVCYPLDFINRRTDLLFFNMPRLLKYKTKLLDYFQKEFKWDLNETTRQKALIDKEIAAVTNFL